MHQIRLLAIALAVRASLSPLRRFRDQLEARHARDLSPVPSGDLPPEIAPVANTLNRLLHRLKATFDAGETAIEIMPNLVKSKKGQAFMADVEAYCKEYGVKPSMYPHEYVNKLWVEDPVPCVETIKGYLASDYDFPTEYQKMVDDHYSAIEELKARLHTLKYQRKVVGYIDPLDLTYNRTERRPKPKTQAVMFCLMDVSASMTEDLKELSKRFFMLLHLFLTRHYSEVDIVFIRHTTKAQEVDEDTFFRATETGGTVISSALDEMLRVVRDRYPVDDWNIYAAQASDGHNFDDDMNHAMSLLQTELLPVCQYYAYIEVYSDEHMSPFQSVVWSGYETLDAQHENFAMKRVSGPGEIYPVFRELFSTTEA